MSTITINGTFTGSVNNFVQVDIYRPNPDSYDFSKEYIKSFTITLDDLPDSETFFFDLSGYAAGGQFKIDVTGDMQAEIHNTYNNDFKPGLTITTT
jgi:hypothetical protein